MPPFRKARASAPDGYFAWEAAGLRWLADAQAAGGARVVEVPWPDVEHLGHRRVMDFGVAIGYGTDAPSFWISTFDGVGP
ncbi:MAG: hypothetical protein WAR57_14810, partial [Candidatus Phosphoribacter sp.]